jgi:hypothetical protein
MMVTLGEYERAALLHDAHAAAEAHDYATAAAHFDRLASDTNVTAEALCEAGWSAHLSGRDDVAAERMDMALRLFGPPSFPGNHEPFAGCAFDRGQLFEALHDTADAARSYDTSVRAFPSATVQARLDALALPEDTDAVDGIHHVGNLSDGIFLAPSRDALVHAMSHGFRRNTLAGHARVSELGHLDLPGPPAGRATVYVLDDLVPYDRRLFDDSGSRTVVVAFDRPNGFVMHSLGSLVSEVAPSVTVRIEGGALRIELHAEYVDSSIRELAGRPSVECRASFPADETWVGVCSLGAEGCMGMDTDGVPRSPERVWTCTDADAAPVDVVDPQFLPIPEVPTHVTITVSSPTSVHLTYEGGPPADSDDVDLLRANSLLDLCPDHDWCPTAQPGEDVDDSGG